MTAFVACRGQRPLLFPALGCLAVAFAAVALPEHGAGRRSGAGGAIREPVTVHLDQAKLLKLPERTATLVIGNPLIADAAVQPGGVVVITAKSYGMTNLVALDRTGAHADRISDPGGRPERRHRRGLSRRRARDPIAARRTASGGSRSAIPRPISPPT